MYGLCGFPKNIRLQQICREINPVDSVIHLFNNQGQKFEYVCRSTFKHYCPRAVLQQSQVAPGT